VQAKLKEESKTHSADKHEEKQDSVEYNGMALYLKLKEYLEKACASKFKVGIRSLGTSH
jgi:hypothetical protein